MYLSLNWLKELVKIPKGMTPEEIALKLTMHTVEVDSVEKQGDKFKNVVIGKILKITKHPNADKLQIAQVDVGKEVLSIVCGAPNITEGQYVPVALVGAVLSGGLEIKEAEVRGEKSYGMLCAEDELGLGPDHSGIMKIEGRPRIGSEFADYLKYDDIIIEVDNKSITHRPDLWCHLGIAREMAVFLNTKLTAHAVDISTHTPIITDKDEVILKVAVEDQKLCPRYMAVVMDGLEVKESPEYIQQRLIGVGMRPLNNIVDITNYVMLELGQPLHSFDAGNIKPENPADGNGIEILVKKSVKGETIDTLDGKKRKLDEGTLLIANKEKPLAIAGVMGGESSEISFDTKSIVIESANFDHVSIRKTSQKLSLRTEASMRYEKALDPNLCETALRRCISLLKEVCPNAKVVSQVADEKDYRLDQGPITVPFEWIEKMVGVKLDKKWTINTLGKLGFVVEKVDHSLSITVPTWRATRDIQRAEDIVEEVARIFGYDNIEKRMPEIRMQKVELNEAVSLKRKIRNLLAYGCGLDEVTNYSFVGEDQLNKMGIDHSAYVHLLNPIAAHLTMLRQNLAPNMLMNVVKNQPRYADIGIFEIGNIYLSSPGNLPTDNVGSGCLPFQEERVGIVVAGDGKAVDVMRKAKGIVDYLAKGFSLEADFTPTELKSAWEDAVMAGNIAIGGMQVGRISSVERGIAKNIGLKKHAVAIELGLTGIMEALTLAKRGFEEFEKYPPAVRDLAFVVDKKILYNDIRDEIKSFSPLIRKVELFDVFEGMKLGPKNKSLAFHIVYQADKTMTSQEVDNLQEGLIKRLEEKFDAKVRDF